MGENEKNSCVQLESGNEAVLREFFNLNCGGGTGENGAGDGVSSQGPVNDCTILISYLVGAQQPNPFSFPI